MLIVTLSGVLLSDCETKTDSRGAKLLSFLIGTEETDVNGRKYKDNFRCYCYNMSNPQVVKMKKGDVVMLSGTFRILHRNGNTNFDIYVKQITPMLVKQE